MLKLFTILATLFVAPLMPVQALELHRGVAIHEWLNWSPLAPDGTYEWPPYRDETAWLSGYRNMSDWPSGDVFDTIIGLGFDFVRLTVDPGPLLASSGTRRDEALSVIAAAVRRLNDRGLNIVLDLHAVRQVPQYGMDFIMDGPKGAGVARYQSMVADVAAIAEDIGTDRIALEPFNEPAYYPCGGEATAAWQQIMASTVATIRAVSQNLTIIATGGCGGSIAGLLELDPSFDDPNIYYSFHMYEPHSFTHQGLDSDDDFLSGLPWPADTGSSEAVIAHLKSAIAQAGLDPDQAANALAKALPIIADYFAIGEGQDQLDARFASLVQWADDHDVSTSRLFMGEFGATLISPDQRRGAFEDSRSRYVAAVRHAAEQLGMAWSIWEFSNPFGFSLIERDGPAVPDPGLLEALELTAH